MGMKACVKAAHLIDSDENLHCFTLPLSRCYIKISVVSQSRCTGGISWLFNISTHSLSRFFLTDWQLAPTGLHSDLVTADADWHRLNLLTDSTSPETQTQIWNWLRQRPPRTPVVHHLQTVHCGLPLRQRWQNSCILSSRLMMTPYEEDMLPMRFQETAQSGNCPIRTDWAQSELIGQLHLLSSYFAWQLLHATLVLVFWMHVPLVLDLYSFPLTKNVKLS